MVTSPQSQEHEEFRSRSRAMEDIRTELSVLRLAVSSDEETRAGSLLQIASQGSSEVSADVDPGYLWPVGCLCQICIPCCCRCLAAGGPR
jgi:hypothetical protein